MLEQSILDKLAAAKDVQTVQVTSEVSDTGKAEIFKFLSGRYGAISFNLYNHSSWSDFNWQNTDASGQSMAQRLKTRLYKQNKIRLKPEDVSQIGNLADQYGMSINRTCHFTVTGNLRWKAGDFGDGGSCYFTNHKYSVDVLEHNKALALQFWGSDETSRRGIGRCWIAFAEEGLLLFNSYGLINTQDTAKQSSGGEGRRDSSLLKMAMVLGAYLGLECTKTRLTINRSYDDPIFINREEGAPQDNIPGGNAILLAPKQSSIALIDLEMEDNTLSICDGCNRSWRGKPTELGFKDSPNGLLCSSCFERKYFVCGGCEQIKDVESRKPVGYAGYACKECLKAGKFPQCSSCGIYKTRKEVFHSDDNKVFCRECFHGKVDECACCTRKFHRSLMNRNEICPVCVEERRRTRRAVEKVVGAPVTLYKAEINPEEAPLFYGPFYKQLKEFANSIPNEEPSDPDLRDMMEDYNRRQQLHRDMMVVPFELPEMVYEQQ